MRCDNRVQLKPGVECYCIVELEPGKINHSGPCVPDPWLKAKYTNVVDNKGELKSNFNLKVSS